MAGWMLAKNQSYVYNETIDQIQHLFKRFMSWNMSYDSLISFQQIQYIFEYICILSRNNRYLFLICNYGFPWFSNLVWQKLELYSLQWKCLYRRSMVAYRWIAPTTAIFYDTLWERARVCALHLSADDSLSFVTFHLRGWPMTSCAIHLIYIDLQCILWTFNGNACVQFHSAAADNIALKYSAKQTWAGYHKFYMQHGTLAGNLILVTIIMPCVLSYFVCLSSSMKLVHGVNSLVCAQVKSPKDVRKSPSIASCALRWTLS